MRVLKNTLVFIMGMIVGIILFVVAIGGAAYAIATSVSIGQLEDQLGIDFLDKNSEIGNKSVFEVVKMLLDDVQNIDKLTVNDLIERYGLPVPENVSGIDITSIFDYPLLDVPNHLGDLVNSVTLKEIGDLVSVDFGSYNIPILSENLNGNVQTALDALLSSINSDSMSLRKIENNFGITLGNNEILDSMKDAPLSSFGGLMNSLTVGDLVNIKLDSFINAGDNEVWANVDRYEEVAAADYGSIADGAQRYIESADENGNVVYKELRYVKKSTTDANGVTTERYVVDNASNAAAFTPAETPVVYYRHIIRERYKSTGYPNGTIFCVPAYVNEISLAADTGAAQVKTDGFINLDTLFFLDNSAEKSANTLVNGAVFAPRSDLYYKGADGIRHNAEAYGLNPEKLPTAKSKLEAGFNGFYRVNTGEAAAIQALSNLTLSSIGSAMDKVMELKLGDILTIDESSPAILVSMKDKTLGSLQDTIDDISLGDIVSVKTAAYIADADGAYVFVNAPDKERYVLYDAAKHAALQRYNAVGYTENANGKYVKYNENYYLYDAADSRFETLNRYDRTYEAAADGIYVKVASGGYFTLYNPADYPDAAERYSVYVPAAGTDPFVMADSARIASKTDLFYYDANSKTMVLVTPETAAQAHYYVKGSADSKALQRLAFVSVKTFADSFNRLILGDVLDIAVDSYKLVATGFDDMNLFAKGTDYYVFDGGLYRLADVFDPAFQSENAGAKIYAVSNAGAGNAILKKLALVGVNDLGAKMDAIIDSLYLSDIIDIPVSAYIENDDGGGYVYFPNGGYYTLYNAGDPSQIGLKRFSKLTTTDNKEYVFATRAQIEDASVTKYYYDYNAKALAQYTGTGGGALFVEGKAASKALQRFAKVSVGNFGGAFGDLILADVLDVDGDVYAKTQDVSPARDKDYYTYSNGVYSLFEGNSFAAGTDYYDVSAYGQSHVVLKKLAFVKIDDMAAQMPTVIQSVYLSELISVYTGSAVKEFAAGGEEASARYIVAPRDELTEVGANNSVHRYTYVSDNSGKYYKTTEKYVKVDDSALVANTLKTVKYDYTSIGTAENYTQLLIAAGTQNTAAAKSALYLYYKNSSGEYVSDAALTSYLLSQGKVAGLYYKKPSADGAQTAAAYKKGGSAAPLYVVLAGNYVSYDPDIPAHADLQKYFKQTNGYAIIDNNNPDVTAKYYFDFESGTPVTTASADTGLLTFAKIEAADGKYYFSEIDSGYNSTDAKYSKKDCESVYKESANGDYIYQNGAFIKVDGTPAAGTTRYDLLSGYLATAEENAGSLSVNKTTIVFEKSVPVLLAFADKKVTVANLGEKMREFTLGDLIEIAPDSMFDNVELKTATMSNVSAKITSMLFGMTFSDLIKWGNITGVNPRIAEMLSGVKMTDLVKGLTVSSAGLIYVDIEKIYGIS